MFTLVNSITQEWEARLMCEMSCASNCPNLPYLLVGFKKVQQLLAVPGVLERYEDVLAAYYPGIDIETSLNKKIARLNL